jgi:hypothetical protein
MLQGITVDLGTGRENESSLLIPGYFQRIDRPDAPGFKGLNREAQIVGGRRRGCKVKYVVNLIVDTEESRDIAVD